MKFQLPIFRNLFNKKKVEPKPVVIKSCQHVRVKKVRPIAGFSTTDIGPGETAKILTRAYVTSDQPEFYLYAEQIANIFLGNFLVDGIHTYLILIHNDLSGDIYINNLPIIVQTMLKKGAQAGDVIRIKDIVDIKELKFQGISIKSTDSVIFLFKKGWKFGLFFDLNQTNKKYQLDVSRLYHDLGTYYKYLMFQDVYSILENEKTFDILFNDGWFPFIQLLRDDFKNLAKYYRDKEKFFSSIKQFMNSFDKTRVDSFIDRWWSNKIFNDKKSIISAGIEAYLRGTEADYITSIKTLYSEIEGIIRISYTNDNPGKRSSFRDLTDYVKQKAGNRFVSTNSLGFPDVFFKYLAEVVFKDFDLDTGQVDLSRHSVSHGVAKSEDYNQMKALQGILVLDQISFYLV